MVWKLEVTWSKRLKPKRFCPPSGCSWHDHARETARR